MHDRRDHWERVYSGREPTAVTWYQAVPTVSLRMIEENPRGREAAVIDVGGGASVLVDHLLELGYPRPCVLDISGTALAASRDRLGERADAVDWIEADVTRFRPERRFDVWHDRAVFHFLVDASDRRDYLTALRDTLTDEGEVVVAAFAPDGPDRCSGLPVVRYDGLSLAAELGDSFVRLESVRELHRAPSGVDQQFAFHRFRRIA